MNLEKLRAGKLVKANFPVVISFFFMMITPLVGCVNYFGIHSTKKIAEPSQFQTDKSIPQQQGTWPSIHWIKAYKDPELTLLIKEALANNPDLHVAKARISQAQALASTRAAALWPSINFQGAAQRGRLSATLFPPILGGGESFTLGEFLLRLNYELDIWGKNLSRLKQARAEQKQIEASFYEAQLSIATSVAITYNQLDFYYALRKVLKRVILQRQALDKISALRLQTGLDTKVQVYQSQNSTATAQTQLVEVEGQIVLTRQQLALLLGAGPDRGLTIKRPHLKELQSAALPANLPLNLLGRRPDIVSARWRVEASCYGVRYVKAQFYPNINLTGLAGFLSLGLNRLFESASKEYQIGPAINLPIFDAAALRNQLRGQYAVYEEAVASYDATLVNALSEVASAIAAIQSTNLQLNAQNKALHSAHLAYNIGRYQYRTGLASQLIVLQAETSFLNEQQARLQLLMNRRNLQFTLFKALGGGFQYPTPISRHIITPTSGGMNTPTSRGISTPTSRGMSTPTPSRGMSIPTSSRGLTAGPSEPLKSRKD